MAKGGEWGNVSGVLGIFFKYIKENGEMNGKWGNLYIFFIEVDLWLILFFKVENSGGMGDVLESAILIYWCARKTVLSLDSACYTWAP